MTDGRGADAANEVTDVPASRTVAAMAARATSLRILTAGGARRRGHGDVI
jgi:hypothetical protein